MCGLSVAPISVIWLCRSTDKLFFIIFFLLCVVVFVEKKKDELLLDLAAFHKQKGRYLRTKSGYVIDRHIIRYYIAFFILSSLLLLFTMGGLKLYAYAYCPVDAPPTGCENALYGYKYFGFACKEPACLKETLAPGEELGSKPPSLWGFYFFQLLLFICAIIINHMINNDEVEK